VTSVTKQDALVDVERIISQIETEPHTLLAGRDIAYVLRVIRELRAENERLSDEHATWRHRVNGLTWAEVIDGLKERDELRAENERLRVELRNDPR
jgi:FtsZ-binding cell division protein ZapB